MTRAVTIQQLEDGVSRWTRMTRDAVSVLYWTRQLDYEWSSDVVTAYD